MNAQQGMMHAWHSARPRPGIDCAQTLSEARFKWLLSCKWPICWGEKGVGDAALPTQHARKGSGRFGVLLAPETALTTSWQSGCCISAQIAEAAGQPWQQSFAYLCVG